MTSYFYSIYMPSFNVSTKSRNLTNINIGSHYNISNLPETTSTGIVARGQFLS